MARSSPTTHGRPLEIVLFWFMLIALVAVVAAVALAVLGNGGALPEAEHDRLDDPLAADRPVRPDDLDALRIAVTLRGYRMADVDDILDRLGAELAERDARIAELEAALSGAHDAALGGPPIGRQAYGPDYGGNAPGYSGGDQRYGGDTPGYGGAPAYGSRPPYGRQPGAGPAGGGQGMPGQPGPGQGHPGEAPRDPWRRPGE